MKTTTKATLVKAVLGFALGIVAGATIRVIGNDIDKSVDKVFKIDKG